MAIRNRSGFTLVELLVVITIIALLAGLTLPALLGGRDRARTAQCMNNQKEIAGAILQYENQKRNLPGYINRLGSNAVGWVPILLQYLGRNDLWEDADATTKGWRSLIQSNSNPQTQRIAQLVCPNAGASEETALTYVLNVGEACGLVDGDLFNSTLETGVFRCLVPLAGATTQIQSISLSSIKSTSQRPMLSERKFTVNADSDEEENSRVWDKLYSNIATKDFPIASLTAKDLTAKYFGFPWIPRDSTNDAAISWPFVENASEQLIHPGIILITFCDGHTQQLSATDPDMTCKSFDTKAINK